MRARHLTLATAVAALALGVAGPAAPALAEDHPEAYVSIEEGPALIFPREAGIALRYSCYGDPTTVSVTVTAGDVQASGSTAITCQGETDLPVGLALTVPESSPGFPPGTYVVTVRATIPGQASLVTDVKVEGPPARASVDIVADASPEEVTKGDTLTVFGVIRRGGVGEPLSAGTALEFRPDGGHWRTVKHVTSNERGILSTTVKARRSGNFRYTFAGDPENEPATSNADHVVVRPKPRSYPSCAALTKVYKHGVGKAGATEQGLGITNWTRNTVAYQKNVRFDRDRDGVACEKV